MADDRAEVHHDTTSDSTPLRPLRTSLGRELSELARAHGLTEAARDAFAELLAQARSSSTWVDGPSLPPSSPSAGLASFGYTPATHFDGPIRTASTGPDPNAREPSRDAGTTPRLVPIPERVLPPGEVGTDDAPTVAHSADQPTDKVDLEVLPVEAAAAQIGTAKLPEDRYEDLGRIGLGGMGEVRRVRDRDLHRTVAMKIIRDEYKSHPRAVGRFMEEAQVSAQLQHPGIVSVHDIGRLADDRMYFTMTEIRGRTLGEVIRALHQVSSGDRWETSRSGWTFRRVVEAFRKVCEAVAYAHSRGVLHRDLKPENIMLGAYGEVFVMDWGLARLHGQISEELDELDRVRTGRREDDPTRTRHGTVAGTPAYMAPEQARGELDRLGPRTDVYALGAMLYEILSGRAPFSGRDAVKKVVEGPPRPLGERSWGPRSKPATLGPPIPRALRLVCSKAMSRESEDRYADAGHLADALASWLEGAKKRENALALVRQADELEPRIRALRNQARELRTRSERVLTELPADAPVACKREAWDLQDRAAALEQEAELTNVEMLQHLRSALNEAPDTAEAHDRLAAIYRVRHEAAEARRDAQAEAALAALLRTHDTGKHAAYLEGRGQLVVKSHPAGADARLSQFVEEDRRLVERSLGSLGRTPVTRTMDRGSYMLRLHAPGRAAVSYPFRIDRMGQWNGGPVDAEFPEPVPLPPDELLGPEDVYVPPGRSRLGGDRSASEPLPAQDPWVPGFVMRRFPVTNQEYVAFLNHLVQRGQADLAIRHAPRVPGIKADPVVGQIYRRQQDGTYALPISGSSFARPGQPVTHIDWRAAAAFARYEAMRTGLPWRLPTEVEWEKAARAVDGRFFPWGDHLDPGFCCYRATRDEQQGPPDVGHYPLDISVYGVRGLAGGVREWCADRFRDPTDAPKEPHEPEDARPHMPRVIRGGSWSTDARATRSASRDRAAPSYRAPDLGFRLTYPLSEVADRS